MNKKAVLFSVLVAAVLGIACVLLWQRMQSAERKERAAAFAAQTELAARSVREDRLKEVERQRERVDQQNKELAELTRTLRAAEAKQASNVTALTQQIHRGATNGSTSTEGDAAGDKSKRFDIASMMKDPAMKEMMRSQQKAVIKTMYGPLFKDLNLSGEQQKKFSELLVEAQLGGVESAVDLFGGDSASKTNAVNSVASLQKKLREEVKSLLGDDKFAQYEDYQKSMGDRMVLNEFQKSAAGTDTAVRDDQMKLLVLLMKDERAKNPPIISEDPSQTAESLTKLTNPELMEQQFKWQDEYNKRVLERAGSVLSPAQMKEFAEFQEQQSNMQKLGIKMAREMFGGNKNGGAPGEVFIAPTVK